MRKHTLLAAVAGIALVALSAPATRAREAAANDLDRMTFVKFNRPVALPGVALGAGIYVFELADPIGAADVVRVSSQDRRRIYLTAFTRIVDKPAGLPAAEPITFGEAPDHAPQPISVWWPSNESTGRQFVY